MTRIRTVGFAGSLRAGSFNRALLEAAFDRAPENLAVEIFDLGAIPLYNADVEAEGDPPPVAALKAAIHAADLVVIATPEYNQGLPAVTKNAVDWASRPPRPQAWDGKPVAIMGTSPGRLGTVGAQRNLRDSLGQLNAHVMPQPRVLIPGAGQAFEDGRLIDDSVGDRLTKFMEQAAAWAARLGEDV